MLGFLSFAALVVGVVLIVLAAKRRRWSFGGVGVTLLLVGVLVGAQPVNEEAKAALAAARAAPTSKWSANDIESFCVAQVKKNLISPRSGKRSDYDTKAEWSAEERTWVWVVPIEAQNAFGVWLQSNWMCMVFENDEIIVTRID